MLSCSLISIRFFHEIQVTFLFDRYLFVKGRRRHSGQRHHFATKAGVVSTTMPGMTIPVAAWTDLLREFYASADPSKGAAVPAFVARYLSCEPPRERRLRQTLRKKYGARWETAWASATGNKVMAEVEASETAKEAKSGGPKRKPKQGQGQS